jgi:hypothetical protein
MKEFVTPSLPKISEIPLERRVTINLLFTSTEVAKQKTKNAEEAKLRDAEREMLSRNNLHLMFVVFVAFIAYLLMALFFSWLETTNGKIQFLLLIGTMGVFSFVLWHKQHNNEDKCHDNLSPLLDLVGTKDRSILAELEKNFERQKELIEKEKQRLERKGRIKGMLTNDGIFIYYGKLEDEPNGNND